MPLVTKVNYTLGICYVGSDIPYWMSLQAKFQNRCSDLTNVTLNFSVVKFSDKEKAEEVFLKIHRSKWNIVYLDFSKNAKEMMILAQWLAKEASTRSISCIGLIDPLSSPKTLKEVIIGGLKIAHIKSGEFEDVIYDALVLFNADLMEDPPYATANFNQYIKLSQHGRLISIGQNSMQVEGNFILQNGQQIELKTQYSQLVSTKNFVVREVKNNSLKYNYLNSYTLSYEYSEPSDVGNAEPKDDADLKAIKERVTERVLDAQKKIKTWMTQNYDGSIQEKTRILVVDKELTILKQIDKKIDRYPFDIEFQSIMPEIQKDIVRFFPHFIIYQYEQEQVANVDNEEVVQPTVPVTPVDIKGKDKASEKTSSPLDTFFNRWETLGEIITTIKKIADYRPFIIVFNQKIRDAKFLQTNTRYERILVYPHSFDLEVILKVVGVFSKKYFSSPAASIGEGGVSIRTEDALKGSVEILPMVQLIAATEAVIYFKSEGPVSLYSVYKMDFPINMYITVVPHWQKGHKQYPKDTFKALIHGLGESDKKEMRKFVYSVYFKDIEEKKLQDKVIMQKIYDQALEKRTKEMDTKNLSTDGQNKDTDTLDTTVKPENK